MTNNIIYTIVALVIFVCVFWLTNYSFCVSGVFSSCNSEGENMMLGYLFLSLIPLFIAAITMLISNTLLQLFKAKKSVFLAVPLFSFISIAVVRLWLFITTGSLAQTFAHDVVYIIAAASMAVFISYITSKKHPNKSVKQTV